MDGQHFGYVPRAHSTYYPDDDSPLASSGDFAPHLHQLNTLSTDNLHQSADFDDPNLPLISPQEGPKAKRRQHGADHIKHKRTRSGCYTCRQRRVKCDETHPTCERCRKGKRECVYPDPSSLKPSRDASKSKSGPTDSGSNSSGDEQDDGDSQKLPPIADEEGGELINPVIEGVAATTALHDSMSPSSKERSPASPTDPNAKAKRPQVNRQPSKQQIRSAQFSGPKWAALPKDIRFYIKYHRDNITCHHYALKYDGSNFLKTTFLEIALSYEPLLYAITAFSAYFHTLQQPNGKIQMFLSYYNKSVTLLRESLAKTARHNTAALLAILQLATFEEYLGDWVNVHLHQKAAQEILTQLFTITNIMQNETRRKIISWYLRFDIVCSIMSGAETSLGREWHTTVTEYYIRQAADKPNDLGSIFEANHAKSRLLATDIALLFGKKGKGAISDQDFGSGIADLKKQVAERDGELESSLANVHTFVKDFPRAPTDHAGEIVDATSGDFLYAEEYDNFNMILIDWWAIKLMFLGQIHSFDKTINPLQLVELSYKICQYFAGMQHSRKECQSVVLGAHASLGIACTTLPKDKKHADWCRDKFARIEQYGYVYPASFRTRMTDLWGISVHHWWLDNDEGFWPILRQVREFAEYRTSNPQNAVSDALRSMRHVFKAMTLDDEEKVKTPDSSRSDDRNSDDLAFNLNREDMPWMDSSPDNIDWTLSNSAEMQQTEWHSGAFDTGYERAILTTGSGQTP